MDDHTFTQGVRPGSVTTRHEVLILICYMMRRAGQPVSYEQLSQALMRQQLVNYFEFADGMSSLEKSGHIAAAPDAPGCWVLTRLGEQAAETFEKTLPPAVRERAADAMEKILTLLKRQQQNHVFIKKQKDGYTVTLTITDIGSDLLSVSIFMPTREECEAIRRRFLNDPALLYKGVFALLTGDIATVGDLIPNGEDLFEE